MHNGRRCAVFTDKDLINPKPARQFKKVAPLEKKAMPTLSEWDRRVREKRERQTA